MLLTIGGTIGGGALYASAALALGINLVGYWFSDKLALKASRARPLSPAQAPGLTRMVEELAVRAAVPVPRLYVITSEQPNAFAPDRNPAHAALAVTAGLLHHLPAERCAAYSRTSSRTSRPRQPRL